jgi:diguanylate cyclase (GGDEF)-like protein
MSSGLNAHRPHRGRHVSLSSGGVVRCIALCVAAAALTYIAGARDGPWLSVPLVLIACAGCRTPRDAATGAAAVTLAGLAPWLARAVPGPNPLVGSQLVVVIASAAVLIVVRERLLRQSDALRGYALTDPLTGIANRRSLLARADYEIARHGRARRTFALVMIDLDGFKRLNDRFGHAAGDDLLRDVASSLEQAMRAQDTVARFGGDEFCVLAPETDSSGIERLATRVSQAVGDVTAGVDAVRASIGIAVFPDDGVVAADLMQAADQRLLEAKRRRGRGRREAQRAA